MERIRDWSAARSGDAITVHGSTEAGERRTIANIRELRPVEGGIEATAKDGSKHLLLPHPQPWGGAGQAGEV